MIVRARWKVRGGAFLLILFFLFCFLFSLLDQQYYSLFEHLYH